MLLPAIVSPVVGLAAGRLNKALLEVAGCPGGPGVAATPSRRGPDHNGGSPGGGLHLPGVETVPDRPPAAGPSWRSTRAWWLHATPWPWWWAATCPSSQPRSCSESPPLAGHDITVPRWVPTWRRSTRPTAAVACRSSIR